MRWTRRIGWIGCVVVLWLLAGGWYVTRSGYVGEGSCNSTSAVALAVAWGPLHHVVPLREPASGCVRPT